MVTNVRETFFVRSLGNALFVWEDLIMKDDLTTGDLLINEFSLKKIEQIEKSIGDDKILTHSRHHMIMMNRIFREHVGGSFLPFPEVDNLYERIRSKIIVKFGIQTKYDKISKRRRRKRKFK